MALASVAPGTVGFIPRRRELELGGLTRIFFADLLKAKPVELVGLLPYTRVSIDCPCRSGHRRARIEQVSVGKLDGL